MKLFLLNAAAEGTSGLIEEDKARLGKLYRLLNCDVVESTVVDIDGESYNVFCDEEGKMKTNLITFIGSNGEVLVGNLLVTGPIDEDGEITGLTDDQIKKLGNHMKSVIWFDENDNDLYYTHWILVGDKSVDLPRVPFYSPIQ